MQEKQFSVRPATDVPGAKHHICMAFENRPQQELILIGVGFGIRILNDQQITGCLPDTGMYRTPFPLIHLVPEVLNGLVGVGFQKSSHRLVGAIRRAVVYHDDLLLNTVWEFDLQYLLNNNRKRPLLIIRWYNNGKDRWIGHERGEVYLVANIAGDMLALFFEFYFF